MSSDEPNERAEEKMPENAADSQPTPPDEGAEMSTDAEPTPQDDVKEVAAAPAEEPSSSSEKEEGDGEVSEVNSQLETDSAQGRVVAAELAVDLDEHFSEERIERILDIELPVSISFGSTKRPLSEVLKLGPGALLELDRAADEPVLLKVNNRVFAKGEIVDVDGYYGVQITEISSPVQRIVSLGDKV